VLPADDNAARMSLPGTEPLAPAAPRPGEATVTQLAPRLTAGYAAAPQQNGTTGSGADGWARHERPGAARPPVPQPAPPAFPPQPAPTPSAPLASPLQAPPAQAAPVTAAPRGEVSPQPTAVPAAEAVTAAAAPAAEAVTPPAAPAIEAVTPAAQDEATQTPASAPPEPAGEQQAGRPGRKTARGKRSSVPSWDEIMFGSSRQQD
jgi:hypothetical protein